MDVIKTAQYDEDQIANAVELLNKIRTDEGEVFTECVCGERKYSVIKLFNEDGNAGIFFSLLYYGSLRMFIAFEEDAEEYAHELSELIRLTAKKYPGCSSRVYFKEENKKLIESLRAEITFLPPYPNRWHYTSQEFLMDRNNFNRSADDKRLEVRTYDDERLDDYLSLLDGAMTFASPLSNFRGDREQMRNELTKKVFRSFYREGRLVGVYWLDNDHYTIEVLAVSPEHQRRGYGGAMLSHAIETVLNDPKQRAAKLYCVDWNANGLNFYKKFGMIAGGHMVMMVLDPYLRHIKIDLAADLDYVLERHCRINYECDTPWARELPYERYRADWFANAGQREEFLSALRESMNDARTIAEIIRTESGETAGYLWVPFHGEDERFIWAEVQDLYVEEAHRRGGVAAYLMEYAEKSAWDNGAKVIRSGTGCENVKSQGLHRKLGYYQYRMEYEKVLGEDV